MAKTQAELIQEQEMRERVKHHNTLQDINAVLATKSGKNLIKYLFESLEVGNLPMLGLKEEMLYEHLGFLRAGNSIFKIVSEANSSTAGEILATIERERNEQIYAEARGS